MSATSLGPGLSEQHITLERAIDRTCAASRLNGVIKAFCALVAPCTQATCAIAQIPKKTMVFMLLLFLGSSLFIKSSTASLALKSGMTQPSVPRHSSGYDWAGGQLRRPPTESEHLSTCVPLLLFLNDCAIL